jgi:hypothetical protein
MRKKQLIKCNVYNCAHCICDNNLCNLEEIKVSDCNNEEKKESTICDSYRKRKV